MSSTVAPQASAAASVVSVRDLRKVYGPVVAVDDVSLDVRRGEFLTLLGPSGSGKTTVLGIIAGLIAPTRGTLRLSGEDVTDLPSNLRNIGVVFQSYALFPHMTVAENIAFPLKMHKVPGAEIPARVAQMLQTVQLGDLGDRRPAQLSGGQQQRVALARALVFKPTVLLMDEPLSALDRKLRQQMQLEIKQLQRALALTIVCVTHDQEEALAVSDRIAVMNRGRIEQIGAPEQLYERPSNHFVADFL
ncbi:MAG: ABC transporter ATP-binding protein, partial [Lautropia sp.]